MREVHSMFCPLVWMSITSGCARVIKVDLRFVSLPIDMLYFNTVSPLHTNPQVSNFQRCEHASNSSKEPGPVPSMSDMSETAVCPPSPVSDDPSTLPSPTSYPSSSLQLLVPVHSMPAPVCQLWYCTRYCTIRLKCFLYFVCVHFFAYYFCEVLLTYCSPVWYNQLC